jgi:methionyl aminopeptidase
MVPAIPIKTPAEMQIMREGGKMLGEVFEKIESIIKPGVSTYELDIFAEKIIRAHKGALPGFKGYRGFPGTLCTSVNEEVVHGIPKKNKILKDGDIIGVDCGVLYEGFYTDACITYAVGSINPQVTRFLNVTKQALDKAIEQVKPGGRIGDISAMIQETLEKNGYSPVVECTGHGVGRALHEPPDILNVGYKNSGPMMKTGMMLAIEPISVMGSGKIMTSDDGWTIISADGTLSAHFEHTVLVTEKGYEIIV